MDAEAFDRLVQRLSLTRTRRALAGGALATALAASAVEVDAKKKKKKKKDKDKDKDRKATICHCPSNDPEQCVTIRISDKAVKSHLRQHCDYKGECRPEVVNPCDPDNVCFQVVDTEGEVTPEDNGTFTATAEVPDVFGNLILGVPAGTTFGDLGQLSAEFAFSEGTCGVGSPRFVVFLENGRCPYAQFPPDLCSDPNASGNTGNLIGNDEPFVWNDDLCSGNAANNTYTEVLAAYEDIVIEELVLVTDSSGGDKTVNLDPCASLVAP